MLNDFSVMRLNRFNIRPRYPHEWSEGENVMFLGLAFRSSYSSSQLLLRAIKGFDRFCYINRKGKAIFYARDDS